MRVDLEWNVPGGDPDQLFLPIEQSWSNAGQPTTSSWLRPVVMRSGPSSTSGHTGGQRLEPPPGQGTEAGGRDSFLKGRDLRTQMGGELWASGRTSINRKTIIFKDMCYQLASEHRRLLTNPWQYGSRASALMFWDPPGSERILLVSANLL